MFCCFIISIQLVNVGRVLIKHKKLFKSDQKLVIDFAAKDLDHNNSQETMFFQNSGLLSFHKGHKDCVQDLVTSKLHNPVSFKFSPAESSYYYNEVFMCNYNFHISHKAHYTTKNKNSQQ